MLCEEYERDDGELVHLGGDHEEAEEPVGEQHLDLLVVGGQVALRVVALVGVGAAPLETLTIHYYLIMT